MPKSSEACVPFFFLVKRDLFNCYPKYGRELVLERGVPGKEYPLNEIDFGHMFKVIIILCDLGRIKYIEWKQKGAAAIETAKKALQKAIDASDKSS